MGNRRFPEESLLDTLKRCVRPESFPAVFVFLILSGYLIRPNPTWAFTFYAAVLPLGLWTLWRHRNAPWLRDRGLLLALVAIGWFGLSVGWSVGADADRTLKYAGSWLLTTLFVVLGVAFFAVAPPRWRDRLFALLPWVAIINAMISIGLWMHNGMPTRLTGWAETRHSILGANVMIFAGVVALSRASMPLPRKERLVSVAAIVCVTAFVLLSGSRGAILTWLACVGVFGLLRGWTRTILVLGIIGAVAVGVAAVILWNVPTADLPASLGGVMEMIRSNVNRPSYRLEIWQMTLSEWAKAPIFGWGAAAQADLALAYRFPHSLYFSTLYYTGVVGAVLLVALLGHLALRVVRVRDPRERAFLAALFTLPAVAGLTDLSGLINGPGELWYILWLPVVIIIGRTFKQGDETSCGS